MPLSDFLSEGAEIPAGSALKSTVTNKVLPEWYTNYAMQLLANQAAAGQSPYTPYSAPRLAGFSPDQLAGFETARNAAGAYKPGLDQAFGMIGTAAGMSGAGAAQPLLGQAGATISGALGTGGGLATAAPWLDRAGGNVANVDEYMNPYNDAVVKRIGELGNRNLLDVIMPGLEGRYIKSGQFQGSGQMTDTMRAVRDTSSDILGKQAEFLNTGYTQAQAAKKGDLDRYGNLAGTAGTIGQNWMDALLRGGEAQGALGKTMGDFVNTDASRLGALATTQAGLAEKAQALGMQGAGALADIGKQQTASNQANLDLAYQDFLKQQGYPQEQIDKMLGTYKGIGDTLPTTTTEEGIVPSGVDPKYNPSTISDIASAGTGLAGIIKELHDAGLF